MSDEPNTTPDQQDQTSGQQAGDHPETDWESRFKGLQRKYNLLMETKSELEEQLTSLTSQREQLEKKADTLSVERDTLLSENQTKINELTRMLDEKDNSIKELSSYQKKVKIAKEMGHPELVRVIDSVPNTDDEDTIKDAFKAIIELTQDAVRYREEQLFEGQMPGGLDNDAPPLPTTERGWQDYVEKLPVGSQGRSDAMDAWFDFTQREG